RRGWSGRKLDDVAALAGGQVCNDLTAGVTERFPLVGRLIAAMREAGAAAAEMTGSGPVVFGVFTGPAVATAAQARLKAAFPDVTFIQSRLDPEPAAAPQVAAGEGPP
ncbi:MAG: hypothetical protein MJA84_10070, partial [Firmicutes bacterium]|nr:hypothetical protein [Bacillota bacterium]